MYAPSIDYSYESVIGDGSTTEFTITHNLNTRDIGVISRNTVSPYDFTVVKWEATTVNTAKIIFTAAPSTNSRKITIFNSFGGARYFNNEVTIDMLDDVTISSASSGQFLKYNGSVWINDAIDLGTDTTGNYMADVTAGTGITISHTPGEGSNATVSLNATIDNLSDVVITTPILNQSLVYNGTNWVNEFASLTTYARNAESNTLSVGEVVYLFGAAGDRASVKRASSTAESTSSKTVGVVAVGGAQGADVVIITQGYVSGINLGSYTAGDVLWLGTTPGTFTTTKAVAPNHLVFIGVVTKANSGNGILYVKAQNGYELDELHNVQIANTLATGDFLKYDGTNWVNDPINLSTDTTGSYVASLVAGSGIALANNSGEGATPTVSIESTAWTSYTPSLATNGGTITLGDGSITGAYKLIGKTCHFRAKFTVGSTTSIGANEILIGLPVQAASSEYTFSGAALDNGVSWYEITGVGLYIGSTTQFAMVVKNASTGSSSQGVSSTIPITFGSGDYITISGTYEAA